MPYQHRPLFPSRKDRFPIIQGRIYKMKERYPRFINIVAQNNGSRTSPCIGTLDRTPNTYEIGIFDGKKMNKFVIFFSPTKSLCVNQAVRSLTKATYWTGDILIMRAGIQTEGVVNMRGHDARLADFALKKFTACVAQFGSPMLIPQGLTFTRHI